MIDRGFKLNKSGKNYELTQKFIKWRKVRDRKYNYLRKYNLDLKVFADMKKAQNNRCAICNKTFETQKDTHVDHNHYTMKVRGILCSRCNLGLGNFKDSVSNLENAIKYLKENDG